MKFGLTHFHSTQDSSLRLKITESKYNAVQYDRYQARYRAGTGPEPSGHGQSPWPEGNRQGTGPEPYSLQASGRALGLKAVWQY